MGCDTSSSLGGEDFAHGMESLPKQHPEKFGQPLICSGNSGLKIQQNNEGLDVPSYLSRLYDHSPVYEDKCTLAVGWQTILFFGP